jgi:hypothetical protein
VGYTMLAIWLLERSNTCDEVHQVNHQGRESLPGGF